MVRKDKRQKSQVREWTEAIILALLIAVVVRTFVVQAFKIPSSSMVPTLEVGDHILVWKFMYGIKVPLVDKKLTVIAWLWARTVKSPNPAFAEVDVPLASTFMLSTRAGKEAYVEPVIEDDGYRFKVKVGKPKDAQAASIALLGHRTRGHHIINERCGGRTDC